MSSKKEYSKFGSIVVEIPLHLLYNDKIIDSLTTSGAIVKKKGQSGIIIKANPNDELKITNEGETSRPEVKLDKDGIPKKMRETMPTTRHGYIERLEEMKLVNDKFLKMYSYVSKYIECGKEIKALLNELKKLSDSEFSVKDKLKQIKDKYKKIKKEQNEYVKHREKHLSKPAKRREQKEKRDAYKASLIND